MPGAPYIRRVFAHVLFQFKIACCLDARFVESVILLFVVEKVEDVESGDSALGILIGWGLIAAFIYWVTNL